jgi:hypothetical protein
MHPIQDLFLESFSYELQFDMHFFYMHSYLHKFFYSCKSGCYRVVPDKEEPLASVLDNFYYHLIALSAAFAHCKQKIT